MIKQQMDAGNISLTSVLFEISFRCWLVCDLKKALYVILKMKNNVWPLDVAATKGK